MIARITYLLVCGLLGGLIFGQNCVADTTYLEPDKIYMGDIAELIIEYDHKIPSLYALDTTPLTTDFEVLALKTRVSRIIKDANDFHRMQWRLQITPRLSGQLAVPSLHFGNRSSAPLVLEVAPQPAVLAARQRVFIELEAEPKNPYVGQQIRLQTRLFHQIEIEDAQLTLPNAESAALHSNKDEIRYRVVRDGVQFGVRQASTVLFAQNLGQLRITPAQFQGRIKSLPRQLSAIGPTSQRRILRRSQGLRLDVRAPPRYYSGENWLPAERLEIAEQWTHADAEIRVGDSLEWTIKITAQGLAAAALPADLLRTEADDFRIYADQAVRSDRFEQGNLVGWLEQRFVIIPTRPGRIGLPELKLIWWDLNAEREAILHLPSRILNVVEGHHANQGRLSLSKVSQLILTGVTAHWQNILAMLLAATLFILARPSFRRTARWMGSYWHLQRLEWRLRRACRDHHAAAARRALIAWAGARWPERGIHSLHQIVEAAELHELIVELERLDAALYSAQVGNWQGTPLWRLFRARVIRRDRRPGNADWRMPGLYPHESPHG